MSMHVKNEHNGSGSDSYTSDDFPNHHHSSFPNQPMLQRTPSSSPRRTTLANSKSKLKSYTYLYRIPNRTMRYLCLGLMMTIIIFMLSLVRASVNSARYLEQLSKEKPAPEQPWKAFPFLQRYFGGVRTLVDKLDNVPEYPRGVDVDGDGQGEADSVDWKAMLEGAVDNATSGVSREYVEGYREMARTGRVEECFLDEEGLVRVPRIHAYDGVPAGMPEAIFGSYELVGLRDDICFDRYGKFGGVGYGYSISSGGSGAGLEGDRDGADEVWAKDGKFDYRGIRWADVQNRCFEMNSHRFKSNEVTAKESFRTMTLARRRDVGFEEVLGSKPEDFTSMDIHEGSSATVSAESYSSIEKSSTPSGSSPTPTASAAATSTISSPPRHPSTSASATDGPKMQRTAFIIRTWHDFEYNTEQILYLRGLITELSLLSGGEYTLHFLIHVKDVNLPIWSDEATHQSVLDAALPAEFHGMGTLWSERQMGLIYGGIEDTMYRDLPVHGVYRSAHMPLQWFAHNHPDFDFFWNWEMDARYTGSWLELFSRLSGWAKAQPRKGLWERSHRFYVPAVHGSWDDFKQMVRVQSEMPDDRGDREGKWANVGAEGPVEQERLDLRPIWGAHYARGAGNEESAAPFADDPVPPHSYEKDKYEWGVGEEADLITLNPIFDPSRTNWNLRDDVTGYNLSEGMPPRRAAVITASRLSRRLLLTMHREVALRRHSMFSEMWPATAALHHGLKAVYVPHPVHVDRDWPTKYFESQLNHGPNGASGRHRMSVFGDCCQNNLLGVTWYYNAGFSGNLWKRWWGLRVDGNGGEVEEVALEGRMCLPGMLFHPVKGVDLVVEGGEKLDDAP